MAELSIKLTLCYTCYLFFLNGRIELWPIPWAFPVQLPGTIKAWRMSHLEGILNGVFLWLFTAILPVIPISTSNARRIALAFIVMAWLLPFTSVLDALSPTAADWRSTPPSPTISLSSCFTLVLFGRCGRSG